jgi:hypothetical protein
MSGMLAGLPSTQLLDRVRELVRRGSAVEAELIAHLAEVDARQLYLEEGCSSMFTYCQRVLHFAEAVAYKRIQAARAVRRHPELLAALRAGDLHLSAISLLAPKLTESNCGELIGAAWYLGTDEIKRMLADREPKPDRPACVRPMAEPKKAVAPASAPPAPARNAQPGPSSWRRSRCPPHEREPSRSERSATGSSSPLTARHMRSSKSFARSCGTRSRTATSGRSWPKRLRACSNRCASGSSRRPPPRVLARRRARIRHDIFPPRSSAPSGTATQAVAPTSRRVAGAAIPGVHRV